MNVQQEFGSQPEDMGNGHEVYKQLPGLVEASSPTAEQGHENNAIAEKLRPMVTEERLVSNALNYDVMQLELSTRDEHQIAAIRERLLGMPLVHASRDTKVPEAAKREGLKGHAAGIATRGTTFALDQSIGLDEYVFFNWGRIGDGYGTTDTYGTHLVVVDAHVMLENSIVTPADIITSSLDRAISRHQYTELTDAEKHKLDQDYFGRMVTGEDWLEITARQVHQYAQRNPNYPYPVDRYKGLGEVKIHGSVDPQYILGDTTLPADYGEAHMAMRRWNASILQHGVAFDYTEDTLKILEHTSSFDPEASERFRQSGWQAIMNI
jgi:hypothetical protein